MKFKEDDRFTIGPITGTIVGGNPATVYLAPVYWVTFDGNFVGGADREVGAEELRQHYVNADWFESVAEKVTPTPQEQFAELEVGDKFRVKHNPSVTYIKTGSRTLTSINGTTVWSPERDLTTPDNYITKID